MIEITYDPDWRSPVWDDDVESRPAWFIHCEEHGQLSGGWGFAEGFRAQSSATRHARKYHRDEQVTVTNWYGLLMKIGRS
jgi:hypothetical protein